jgi:adenylate kinase
MARSCQARIGRAEEAGPRGTKVRILLIGPPASGKGTQGRRLASRCDVAYLSSGELLRAQAEAGTALGRRVAAALARGDLVPDEVILDVLEAPLRAAVAGGGYVLDGFPRTVAQAAALDAATAAIGGAPQVAAWFDVADDELARRTRHRAGLEHRSDDVEAVARHRLEVYRRATAPLLDYYRNRGLLVRIDAGGPVEAVEADLVAALAVFGVRPAGP